MNRFPNSPDWRAATRRHPLKPTPLLSSQDLPLPGSDHFEARTKEYDTNADQHDFHAFTSLQEDPRDHYWPATCSEAATSSVCDIRDYASPDCSVRNFRSNDDNDSGYDSFSSRSQSSIGSQSSEMSETSGASAFGSWVYDYTFPTERGRENELSLFLLDDPMARPDYPKPKRKSSDRRIHRCDICGKCFTYPKDVRRHKKTHNNAAQVINTGSSCHEPLYLPSGTSRVSNSATAFLPTPEQPSSVAANNLSIRETWASPLDIPRAVYPDLEVIPFENVNEQLEFGHAPLGELCRETLEPMDTHFQGSGTAQDRPQVHLKQTRDYRPSVSSNSCTTDMDMPGQETAPQVSAEKLCDWHAIDTSQVERDTPAVMPVSSTRKGPINRSCGWLRKISAALRLRTKNTYPDCLLCDSNAVHFNKATGSEHYLQHYEEFARGNEYECNVCGVGFTHKADLNYHNARAERGECGFEFTHTTQCSGHHPFGTNDCYQYTYEIRNWEQAQLQSFIAMTEELHDRFKTSPAESDRWSLAATDQNSNTDYCRTKGLDSGFVIDEDGSTTQSTGDRGLRRQRSCPSFSVSHRLDTPGSLESSERSKPPTHAELQSTETILDRQQALRSESITRPTTGTLGGGSSSPCTGTSESQLPSRLGTINESEKVGFRMLSGSSPNLQSIPAHSNNALKLDLPELTTEVRSPRRPHTEDSGDCTPPRPWKRPRLSTIEEETEYTSSASEPNETSQVHVWLKDQPGDHSQHAANDPLNDPPTKPLDAQSPADHESLMRTPWTNPTSFEFSLPRITRDKSDNTSYETGAEVHPDMLVEELSTTRVWKVYDQLRTEIDLSIDGVETEILGAAQRVSVPLEVSDLRYWSRSCDRDSDANIDFNTFTDVLISVLCRLKSRYDLSPVVLLEALENSHCSGAMELDAVSNFAAPSSVVDSEFSSFTQATTDSQQSTSNAGTLPSGGSGSAQYSRSERSGEKRGHPEDDDDDSTGLKYGKRSKSGSGEMKEQLPCFHKPFQHCPGRDGSISELLKKLASKHKCFICGKCYEKFDTAQAHRQHIINDTCKKMCVVPHGGASDSVEGTARELLSICHEHVPESCPPPKGQNKARWRYLFAKAHPDSAEVPTPDFPIGYHQQHEEPSNRSYGHHQRGAMNLERQLRDEEKKNMELTAELEKEKRNNSELQGKLDQCQSTIKQRDQFIGRLRTDGTILRHRYNSISSSRDKLAEMLRICIQPRSNPMSGTERALIEIELKRISSCQTSQPTDGSNCQVTESVVGTATKGKENAHGDGSAGDVSASFYDWEAIFDANSFSGGDIDIDDWIPVENEFNSGREAHASQTDHGSSFNGFLGN